MEPEMGNGEHEMDARVGVGNGEPEMGNARWMRGTGQWDARVGVGNGEPKMGNGMRQWE